MTYFTVNKGKLTDYMIKKHKKTFKWENIPKNSLVKGKYFDDMVVVNNAK